MLIFSSLAHSRNQSIFHERRNILGGNAEDFCDERGLDHNFSRRGIRFHLHAPYCHLGGLAGELWDIQESELVGAADKVCESVPVERIKECDKSFFEGRPKSA
jgi:hypothetical protein